MATQMMFDMTTMEFLDGPWKGTRQVIQTAAEEGHVINTTTGIQYRVQWNPTTWRWEAATIQNFGDDNAE